MVRSKVNSALVRARQAFSPSGDRLRLLVAVSGGEDSHALLHALVALREECRLDLVAAHFDHGLRPESAQEAEFVLRLGERYGITAISERAPERPSGENIEAWARDMRYRFLETARTRFDAALVATAHHRNDQAETMLFRLVTGRTLTDARGIAELDQTRRVWRPLLSLEKQAIEAYSIENRLDFIVDSSNQDYARTRCKIRHQLLPLLSSDYNPQVVNALATAADRFADDEDYLESEARRVLQSAELSNWKNLKPAIAWRVLAAHAEREVGERAAKLGYRAYQDVLKLAGQGRGERRLDLGFGISCEVNRDALPRFFVAEVETVEQQPHPALDAETLPVPGFVERVYPDGTAASIRAGVIVVNEELRHDLDRFVLWAKEKVSENDPLSYAVEYFDLEQLPPAGLVVRERKQGDRMRIWKRGERRVKKLLLERELPPGLRDKVPVVTAGEKILWIPGVARGEEAPVGPQSRFVLELRYARE
ncbi:MAG: tRNA lysidine(34) synthetase TilS [Bdellovibrionota bacterium]